MLVAPVVSTLGGSWPPVAPAVSVLAAAHRSSVIPAVSTPDCAARRKSALPAVSTRSDSQAFGRAKGQYPPPAVAWCLSRCALHGSIRVRTEPLFLRVHGFVAYVALHGSIRVGPDRTAVPPSPRLRSVRLSSLVPRSRDRASPRQHGVLLLHSIHAHSYDAGTII